MRTRLALSTLAMLAAPACLSSSNLPCDSDAQCYADQFCDEGLCVEGERSSTVVIDEGDGGGGGGSDSGGGGGADSGGDAGDVVECARPSVCASDDDYEKNGDFAHTIYAGDTSLPAGCTQRRSGDVDRFTNVSLSGKLCRDDWKGDLYAIAWEQCGAVAFTIRTELRITTPCDADLYEVTFREDNCDTGFFVCELDEVAPGHWIWSVTLPKNSNFAPSNNLVVDIEPVSSNSVSFDYTLDVTTTQLTE